MPIRICIDCHRVAVIRGRCKEHARQARRYQRSPNDGFYASTGWRRQRAKFLMENPLCADCGAIAEHVHHVQPIEDGGARRDPQNLTALCAACHARRHRTGRLGG